MIIGEGSLTKFTQFNPLTIVQAQWLVGGACAYGVVYNNSFVREKKFFFSEAHHKNIDKTLKVFTSSIIIIMTLVKKIISKSR